MREWVFALAPAVASAIVIAGLRRSRWSAPLADHPNERSLHSTPTPRVGGLGMMLVALPFSATVSAGPMALIVALAAALSLLSLADDVRSLPVQVRLPAHLVAALFAVVAIGAPAQWGWALALAAVVAIAWMANLYNFMDGSDGLAGGMALVGFAALAFAAARGGHDLALACVAIASAAAGFLWHNFPPARVFLGDAGSIPLGFLAGAFGALGTLQGLWPAWFPLLVFSPFIVDATLTVARRLIAGEPVWKAHRSHYYQRLVLAGWPPARLALAAYALMAAAASSALWALGRGFEIQCAIILVWLAIYVSLLVAIVRHVGNTRAAS